MRKQGWKSFVLAGVLGLTGLAVGCTEREEAGVRDDTREVGQELDRAGEDLGAAGREANEDVREGIGGSGTTTDPNIGDKEGVINDGEGPFEQNEQRDEDSVLKEGQGPLEENTPQR